MSVKCDNLFVEQAQVVVWLVLGTAIDEECFVVFFHGAVTMISKFQNLMR